MRRLLRSVADRAPNLTEAVRIYMLLRRQARTLADAGRDGRPPRELVSEASGGALLEIGSHTVLDLHASEAPWTASQKAGELLPFLDRVEALRPRHLCEIGSARGGTLYLLTRVAAPDALVLSVDLQLPRYLRRARERLGRPGQRVVSIAGDSRHPLVRASVSRALAGERLDVLFIDGDHSYDGVRSDFELYAPLVRPGGMIALHDVNPDRGIAGGPFSGDVPRFWRELRERYETEELIAASGQSGYGIGIVYP